MTKTPKKTRDTRGQFVAAGAVRFGSKGGKRRAQTLSRKRRREIAKLAAATRWQQSTPAVAIRPSL